MHATLVGILGRSLGCPASFPIVLSRAKLLQAAREAGVLIPDTYSISTLDDLRMAAEKTCFPFVMKADGTWGGLGVAVVRNSAEADACYRRMTRSLTAPAVLKRWIVNRDAFWLDSWRRPQAQGVILQALVRGRPANCVVFCKAGEVLAALAVEVEAAQNAVGPATKVRVVEGGAMLRAARALVSRLGLSGIHGMDFMLEEESGVPYLIELNARCAMPCHLRVGGGRDLMGALSAELRSDVTPPVPMTSDRVAYFPQAWLADAKDEALRTSYHDVPWSEPDLVKELLLLPWPDRSLLARWSDRLRGHSARDRSSRSVTFLPSPRAAQHPREQAS